MMGLAFTTWENYVAARFGKVVLQSYRQDVQKWMGKAPLVYRVYDDAAFQQGLLTVSRLTHMSVDVLLREFGRYYILNGLTRHLCMYLLNQAQQARDLLVLMRQAHLQMKVGPDHLTPPVFSYEFLDSERMHMLVVYESPRQFCGWFWGAVEGAAERFGETVFISERACIKRGAPHCRFEIRFQPGVASRSRPGLERQDTWKVQQFLISQVLSILPDREEYALTLFEVQAALRRLQIDVALLRPSHLLEILQRLQFMGLLASTAGRGDDLSRCRYWRLPVAGASLFEYGMSLSPLREDNRAGKEVSGIRDRG